MLPASRNTTYAAGARVKSVDLNKIQDDLIDVYRGTIKLGLGDGYPDPASAGDWAITIGSGYAESNGVSGWVFPVNVPAGAVIGDIRVRWRTHATEFLTLSLIRSNGDGTRTVIGSNLTSTTGAGVAYVTQTKASSSEAVADGITSYYLFLSTTAAGLRWASSIEIDWGFPEPP